MISCVSRRVLLFCVLISSCFLGLKALQEESRVLQCIDTIEKDTSIAEKLRNDPLSVDILEIFGAYDADKSDSEFLALVNDALARDPRIAHCALDKHGNTLMHIAVCRSMLELVQKLLEEYKANVNQENGWSMLPLEIADICAYQIVHKEGESLLNELKRELLEQGEDAQEETGLVREDSNSSTDLGAIECVTSFESEEFMGELLRSGSNTVNILELLGKFGYTITNQQLETWILREIEKNAELSHCPIDSHGNTLVHITSCREMVKVTELFLAKYKADVNAVNGWGLTPIDMALLCSAQEQALLDRFLNSLLDQQEQLKMPDLDEQAHKLEMESETPRLEESQMNEINQTKTHGYGHYDTLHDEL